MTNAQNAGIYRAFPPPAEGFDPREASDAELARHGLPRRPVLENEQELVPIWDRLFGASLAHVKAELRIDGAMSYDKALPSESALPAGGGATEFGEGPWAGGLVRNPRGAPFTWAFGEWEIPKVRADAPVWDAPFALGFWVGLDGFSGDQGLLQAGVAVHSYTDWLPYPSRAVRWYAWTEWWTPRFRDPAVAVVNFPVKPGDTVSFLVCAPDPESGSVFMRNATTGMGTSVALTAPEGYSVQGATAEWIVEPKGKPAHFDPMVFTDCRAGSPQALSDHRGAWDLDMYEAKYDAEIVQPNSVTVNRRTPEPEEYGRRSAAD
jgi:hypothetical protein